MSLIATKIEALRQIRCIYEGTDALDVTRASLEARLAW
jgi:hypothetical protein